MGNVIYEYTRADALADGTFVDLMRFSDLAAVVRGAGFCVPFCATQDLYNLIEAAGVDGREGDLASERLWAVMIALGAALAPDQRGPCEVFFTARVAGEDQELLADFTYDDDGAPAVTLCHASDR